MRLYTLRLHEVGLVKNNPHKLIVQGSDWRYLNELKKEPARQQAHQGDLVGFGSRFQPALSKLDDRYGSDWNRSQHIHSIRDEAAPAWRLPAIGVILGFSRSSAEVDGVPERANTELEV